MAYNDKDTLLRKYGVEKTLPQKGGEYVTDGEYRAVELSINLADLTETETVQIDTTVIPAGMRLNEIRVITQTAGATGAGIDLGLVRTDRATEIDYDGLLAALATTAFNAAGKTTVINVGSTSAGALLGTTLTNPGLITASRTTATAFTAGRLIIELRYYRP